VTAEARQKTKLEHDFPQPPRARRGRGDGRRRRRSVRRTSAWASALAVQGPTLASAEAVPANIGEAFGTKTIADRNRVLVIARGEAEETIRHLKTNFTANRLDERSYWLLHNRLVTIVKMLDRLMN
jgi:four helix bundle protein